LYNLLCQEQVTFRLDDEDDVVFVLDQHTNTDLMETRGWTQVLAKS